MKYEFLTKNFMEVVEKFKKVGFTKAYVNIGDNDIFFYPPK